MSTIECPLEGHSSVTCIVRSQVIDAWASFSKASFQSSRVREASGRFQSGDLGWIDGRLLAWNGGGDGFLPQLTWGGRYSSEPALFLVIDCFS